MPVAWTTDLTATPTLTTATECLRMSRASKGVPDFRFYHPGFVLTENGTMNILRTFIDYINTSVKNGYQDNETKHLRAEVQRSKTINYQDAVRLAMAGDTGVGKSALLNAILGVINLNIEVHLVNAVPDIMLTLIQSDDGGACTCAITEFNQSPPIQPKPFAAEVHFFTLAVCTKMVTDLFSQWFRFKQKQRQDPEGVVDVDLGQMKTARDCLQQMFADRLGIQSAEKVMGSATSADNPKTVKKLIKWTTEIHQQFVPDGQTFVQFDASTPERLIEQYHPFTREVPNASFRGTPLRFTPWPLVRLIRVYLDSSILQQNVIVADVPGGSDTNYIRVDNAARYLQECDMTIVVGKIYRLQDNTSFQSQYVEAYRQKRSGSVILVATRSDVSAEIKDQLHFQR